jgi:Ni/Co efflux regulator RcnB
VRASNQADRAQRVQFRQQRVDQRQQRFDQRQQRVGFSQDRVDLRGGTPTLRESNRPLPQVLRNRVVTGVPRQGTQPPPPDRVRTSRAPQWIGNWRNDRRYDWRDYRNRNRARFHFGFYSDPFGWGYSPFSIGSRLWPSYYGSRYWISDPWQYRLPYAPPGTRWVRYWNDAVLVDTWNGQVVDVIRNFFW